MHRVSLIAGTVDNVLYFAAARALRSP